MGIPSHGESDAEVEALLSQQYPPFNESDAHLIATVDSIAGEREVLAQNDIAQTQSDYGSGLGNHATLTIDDHFLDSVDELEDSQWLTRGRDNHDSNLLTIVASSVVGWPLNDNISCSGGNHDKTSGQDLVTLCRGSDESSPRTTQFDKTFATTVVSSMDSPNEVRIQDSLSACRLRSVGSLAQSPSQASAEHIVARHPAKKRKGPDVRTNLLRGKRRRNDWSSLLDIHISREKGKYHGLGVACPQHLFPSALLELPVSFGHTDYREELITFFSAIGSSESLAVFQDMIQMHRQSVSREPRDAGQYLSNAERIRTIERLDRSISYFQFMKRCHTHTLFISSGVPDQQTTDNFVVATCQSARNRKTLRRGNPIHIANAQLTTSMMKEMYPNLEERDADYQRKYRFISTLRVLGQRLNLLVDRFGLGIIGLIPLASGTLDVETIQGVDDRMILSLPEDVFKRIVQFLDDHQGDLLRQLSKEITKVVIGMFHGTLDNAERLFIETIGRSEILKQPGPSQELCSLISEEPRA